MDRSDMPVPDFQSLMLPVLRAVANGDISAADLRSRLAEDLRLTEADLSEMLPSGRQTTFANRTAWANYVGRISKRIVLIDGTELSALMVRNGVGVRSRTVYEIKRVDEDYFSE
jgi:restriction endonuclease Mrr